MAVQLSIPKGLNRLRAPQCTSSQTDILSTDGQADRWQCQ